MPPIRKENNKQRHWVFSPCTSLLLLTITIPAAVSGGLRHHQWRISPLASEDWHGDRDPSSSVVDDGDYLIPSSLRPPRRFDLNAPTVTTTPPVFPLLFLHKQQNPFALLQVRDRHSSRLHDWRHFLYYVCDRKFGATKTRAKTGLWRNQGGQLNDAAALTSASRKCRAEERERKERKRN
ncbi:uncharacterized protein LOC106761437 [Vigna radiata var. radiata]|uniref:Uncharacterized protein LOC106761437 n=1 Tax=Vigna radiata var. radiata TaxID=3916 RepID=A0A1S3U375_VIGRR|nr:uncharacterized protein LOC106761437 [Vigna radiata var. radiata]